MTLVRGQRFHGEHDPISDSRRRAYGRGFAVRPPIVGDLIRMPGEIEDEIRALNNDIQTTGNALIREVGKTPAEVVADMKARGANDQQIALSGVTKLDSDQIAATYGFKTSAKPSMTLFYTTTWSPWRQAWSHFYEDHTEKMLQNMPLSGAWNASQKWRDELLTMRKAAQSAGFGRVAGTGLAVTPEPRSSDKDQPIFDFDKFAKYGLIGIGILGGVMVATTLISSRKS